MITTELKNSKNEIDKLILECLELQTGHHFLDYLSNYDDDKLNLIKNRLDNILLNRQLSSEEKLGIEKLICNIEVIEEDYNQN